MEFGLAILFGIGVAWMYLTTPEQRQMIFGYIIFFTVIMSIIAFFTAHTTRLPVKSALQIAPSSSESDRS